MKYILIMTLLTASLFANSTAFLCKYNRKCDINFTNCKKESSSISIIINKAESTVVTDKGQIPAEFTINQVKFVYFGTPVSILKNNLTTVLKSQTFIKTGQCTKIPEHW